MDILSGLSEVYLQIGPEDLRHYYAGLSDEGLLSLNREDLTDIARQCYDVELANRKLAPSAPPAEAEEDANAGADEMISQLGAAEAGDLIQAGQLALLPSLADPVQLTAVMGFLKSAGIPSYWVKGDTDICGTCNYRVLVPAAVFQDAAQIMQTVLSGTLEQTEADVPGQG